MARHPFFATKSIEALRREMVATHGLKRTLSAFDLTLLGIGAIMGTGVFVITGQAAAQHAGPAVIISFFIAGAAAMLAALCYSEMAAMIPVAGSAYTYAYAAMGEGVAFLIGWDLILAYAVSSAMVSVGWSGYVAAFLRHVTGYELPWKYSSTPLIWNSTSQSLEATGAFVNLPAMAITLMMTLLLIFGIRESARFNAAIVFIKVAVVLIFLIAATPFVEPHNWVPFLPPNTGTFGDFGTSGVFRAATLVFVSYIGLDAVSVAAQEARNPQRDVPIGILASLGVCTTLYIAVALVLTGVVSYRTLAVPHPIAVGIAVTGIGWLETLVDVGAIAGLSSVILVVQLAQPRVIMAMARDGLLPAFAGYVHPRFGTPHLTTALSGLVVALAGGFFSVDVLSELIAIGILFAFTLVSLGVMVLRLTRPELPRPFRLPGGPFLIPLTTTAISIGLLTTTSRFGLTRMGIWLALGAVFYFIYGRRHSKLRAAGAGGEIA